MGAYTIVGWCGYQLACGFVGSIHDQKRGKKMARLIDVDEAYKVLTDYYHQRTEIQHKALKEALSRVPTIDVEPIRHGYWILHDYDFAPAESTQECSVCHKEQPIYMVDDNYCPHCGAKMDNPCSNCQEFDCYGCETKMDGEINGADR